MSEQREIVSMVDGEVYIHVKNVAEAKLAIKQLKLIKKQQSLEKKQIMEQQRTIRAEYTDKVRRRGSMVRGGGGLGTFFRAFQTAARDASRSSLAQQLAPLEQQKSSIEQNIVRLEQAILQLETYMVQE